MAKHKEQPGPVPVESAPVEPAAVDPVVQSVIDRVIEKLNIPGVGSFVFGVNDLASAQSDEVKRLADAYGLGTPQFEEALDRWVAKVFNGSTLLLLAGKLKADVRRLFAEGKGPVQHSPVDVA